MMILKSFLFKVGFAAFLCLGAFFIPSPDLPKKCGEHDKPACAPHTCQCAGDVDGWQTGPNGAMSQKCSQHCSKQCCYCQPKEPKS